MTDKETEALRAEVDFLLQFWLTHSCKKCKDDMKTRLPTKRFPILFNVMEEIK